MTGDRAAALLEMNRPHEALEQLRLALAQDPEDSRLHCLSVLGELEVGDLDRALEAAERAVSCGPEEEWPHRLRAISLLRLDRPSEARAAAFEAARLAPGEAMTYLVLAEALQATGERAGAEDAARHAVELDPDDPDAHTTLGKVFLDQDRPADAVLAYRAALALDAEDADALNNLAVARLRANDRQGTDRQFEAAARLDPRSDVARRNILRTGPAGRTYVYRRFSVLVALLAGVSAFTDRTGAIVLLVLAAGLEVARSVTVRRLSPPTQQLVADDRRARRWRPARWAWGWLPRLPGRFPAPFLLALLCLWVLATAAAAEAGAGITPLLAAVVIALRLVLWSRRRRL